VTASIGILQLLRYARLPVRGCVQLLVLGALLGHTRLEPRRLDRETIRAWR
jgi:hypothetical protein